MKYVRKYTTARGLQFGHEIGSLGVLSEKCKLSLHSTCSGKAGRRKRKCMCLCHGDDSDPLKQRTKPQ